MRSIVNLKRIAIHEAEHAAALKEDAVRDQTEQLPGGLADNMTLQDMADKHGVSTDLIKAEFEMGIDVEMEHTNDPKRSAEIAKDHIYENPQYYTKLKTIEQNN